MDRADALRRAAAAPVARLATTSARTAAVDLVPITFAIVGEALVSAVDHKPKSTRQLTRLDNVRANGTATALVDHWADDWSQLWWVRLRGPAVVHDDVTTTDAVAAIDALVDKYPQYAAHRPAGPLLVVTIDEVRAWSASS
jgi:PPOX class probable F420-dependent enzyme